MKKIVLVTALFALSFATGFTCSKNAPEQTSTTSHEATTTTTDSQAQMAAPANQAAGSADATTAQPSMAQPGTTETTTETK